MRESFGKVISLFILGVIVVMLSISYLFVIKRGPESRIDTRNVNLESRFSCSLLSKQWRHVTNGCSPLHVTIITYKNEDKHTRKQKCFAYLEEGTPYRRCRELFETPWITCSRMYLEQENDATIKIMVDGKLYVHVDPMIFYPAYTWSYLCYRVQP